MKYKFIGLKETEKIYDNANPFIIDYFDDFILIRKNMNENNDVYKFIKIYQNKKILNNKIAEKHNAKYVIDKNSECSYLNHKSFAGEYFEFLSNGFVKYRLCYSGRLDDFIVLGKLYKIND